jgi:hypothetical protein
MNPNIKIAVQSKKTDCPSVKKTYRKIKNDKFPSLIVFDWSKIIMLGYTCLGTHVGDLQHWNNAAAVLYGVQSIPYNVLGDPNGNIVAGNLHGEEKVQTLRKVIK